MHTRNYRIPAYVFLDLPFRTKDLQTSLRKQHEHVQFKTERLAAMRIILIDLTIDELAPSLSCDPSVNACMYRKCEHCKHNTNETAAPYEPDLLLRLRLSPLDGFSGPNA